MKKLLPIDLNFKFSDEERNDLWHILRNTKFRRKDVTIFIDQLEDECRFNFLTSRLKADRKMVSAMIGTFKQANIYFEILMTMSAEVFFPDFFLRSESKDGLKLLTRVIKALEGAMPMPIANRPKGKLPAFIRKIAQDYKKVFDEKPKNGGVFLKMIRQLLYILELPSKNPRNAIREALKDLN